MPHFLLTYELADDFLERRSEWRAEHLALAWAAVERGELILGGALAAPTDQAMLLFEGETGDAAEAFVHADPYVTHGLVRAWRLRPWTTVVGEMAAEPVRP
jgi:uncharacterized protein YciI